MATPQNQWLFYAISSGACAALNGVFAKLTTTTQYNNWSSFFGMEKESVIVEALVRGVRDYSLNLPVYQKVFNNRSTVLLWDEPALQRNHVIETTQLRIYHDLGSLIQYRWGLFTRALTLASSTVRVSVINTSANFMLTAVLGFIIFRESLPGMCEQIQSYDILLWSLLTLTRLMVARSKLPGCRLCDHWKT